MPFAYSENILKYTHEDPVSPRTKSATEIISYSLGGGGEGGEDICKSLVSQFLKRLSSL